MEPKRRPARELQDELRRLTDASSGDRDRAQLLHELHVYQEEITAQNEALREAQAELEQTRDRFIELYDFSPNGYITLDSHGVIHQVNLTGATWLGKHRAAVEGIPLLRFVTQDDRQRVTDFMLQCRTAKAGESLTLDVRLRANNATRLVQFVCQPRLRPGAANPEFLTAMVDITEARRLEAERERAAQARSALAARLISVQEDERQRIARDLHDNIGQRLTGLRLKLEAAAMAAADDAARTRMAEALEATEQIDTALDFIAADLRPTSLDIGLGAVLEEFVREWSDTFRIRAQVHTGGIRDARFDPDLETHVYRIAQEALNNVYKHAHAQSATVVFEQRDKSLVLIIEDDGRGFRVETALIDGRRQLGLVGMRERAQLIGGTIEIESSPGRGTTVFLRIPATFARQPEG